MEEGKFYYKLKFDGGEIESECAKEFEDKCKSDGIVFGSKEAVGMPKSQFDAEKVPELTPHQLEYKAFFSSSSEEQTSSTNAPLMPSNQLGLSNLKWYQDLIKENHNETKK